MIVATLVGAVVVCLVVAQLLGALVTYDRRQQALAARRARSPDAPAWSGVVVVSTFPMRMRCSATRVPGVPEEVLVVRLDRWARTTGYRRIPSPAGIFRFRRGAEWRAAYAFGVDAVPSVVEVALQSTAAPRETCPAVACMMEFRSVFQVVSADDSAHAALEFERLLDALVDDTPEAHQAPRDARAAGRASKAFAVVTATAALLGLGAVAAAVATWLDDPVVPDAAGTPWPTRPPLRAWQPTLPSPPSVIDFGWLERDLGRRAREFCGARRARNAVATSHDAGARAGQPEVWSEGGDSIGGDGVIDEAGVTATIRANLSGMHPCYTHALRANPTLAGAVEVRFMVGDGGRVMFASGSGFPAMRQVGACVARRVAQLTFPPPRGGAVEFSYDFRFCP